MTSSWPPTPSVEDEDAALAREHGLDSLTTLVQSDEEPPVKGTVDQFPIILDVHPSATSPNEDPTTDAHREQVPSQESRGPHTQNLAYNEQRFVLLDHGTVKLPSLAASDQLPRSNATANLTSDDLPRGRPYVSPIRTDIANGFDERLPRRQRAASPYTSTPKQPLSSAQLDKHFAGTSYLAPHHVSASECHTATSDRSRAKHEDASSLTDPERSSEKRRHHSRRRRESTIRSERPTLEKLAPSTSEKHSLSYIAATPATSILLAGLSKHAKEKPSTVDSTRQKRASRDSPYSSAAEEKTRRHRSKSRRRSKSRPRVDKTVVRDSPYTSSAEESGGQRHRAYKALSTGGKLSRRSSPTRKQWPGVEVSDHHYSYGAGDPLTDKIDGPRPRPDLQHHPISEKRDHLQPSSAQSSQIVEDYLAKAFNGSSKASSRTPRASPNPSPFTSPPRTPPRTPRRNRASKDYFDMEVLAAQETPRSRQPSGDESPWNIWRPATSTTAETGAIATVLRTVPTLSRTSTVSINTPSQSSSSKASSSDQRSRRPSPVQDDAGRPASRASSFDVRDDRPLSRAPTNTSYEQRRHSRVPAVITQVPFIAEHTPKSRVSTVAIETPRPISRAYSTAAEEMPRPPPTHRAMSSSQVLASPVSEYWRSAPGQRTPSSTYLTPTSATSSSTFTFSAPRPLSFTPIPVQGPPAPTPIREPPPISLPPCPRSTPLAGYHDWYTVSQVSDINICPTCMGTLGASRFRDLFVPSFSVPQKEISCAMSKLWLRNAFIQAVKQRRTPQEMTQLLYDLLHLPDSTRPCPGKESESRKWYQLIDPYDGSIVPGFDVCTHCVRNVDLVFPQLKGVFKRTTSLLQERICNLSTQSKRFLGYIEQLDKAASRFDADKSLRSPDIQDLAKYARRVANIRDCPRDNMTFSAEWHFMSELPEFTVCPECFEEVVRPVYDRPLAAALPKKARPLPVPPQESKHLPTNTTSCQLYSARMRRVFHDAVKTNDFDLLRDAATQRRDAELHCQAKHRKLMQEASAGHDRTDETLRNVQVWQRWE